MARMRYVKPEFWTDSRMVGISRDARLLYIGTWNFALCDKGHLEDDMLRLKMQVFPADNVDVTALMAELMAAGRIVRVTNGQSSWLWIKRLEPHQKTEARWKPRCPACNASANLSETQESSGEALTSRNVANGREMDVAPANLSETLPNSPQEGRGGDRRGETSSSEVADATPDTSRPDVEKILDHLDAQIRTNGLRVPNRTKKNTDAARLMLDRDGLSLDAILALIDFATSDEFWRTNILSASKLREKADTLRAQAARRRGGPAKGGHPGDQLPW